MATVASPEAAHRDALEVARDAWDPGGELYVVEAMTECEGRLRWADGFGCIKADQAWEPDVELGPDDPVEMWTVWVECKGLTPITLLYDQAGDLCAAGIGETG